jgi:hypothetical protein
MRRQASLPELQQRSQPDADDAACAMAQADKLEIVPAPKRSESFNVLAYTTLRPGTLPAGAASAFATRNLRSFSIGACYRPTPTYPTGTYWIVLSLD